MLDFLERDTKPTAPFPDFLGASSVHIDVEVENEDEMCGPSEDEQARIAICGQWRTFVHPKDRKWVHYQKHCNCTCWCWRCRERLAQKMADDLTAVGPVYRVELDDDAWAAAAKHLSRESVAYRRIPVGIDRCVVYLERDTGYFENIERRETVSMKEINNDLKRKDSECRITGKLGKKSAPAGSAEKGECVTVYVTEFASEATKDQRYHAQLETDRKTNHLDPDAESLQKALDEVSKVYKAELKAQGVKKILTYRRPFSVQISSIRWQNSGSGSYTRYLDIPDDVELDPEIEKRLEPVPF